MVFSDADKAASALDLATRMFAAGELKTADLNIDDLKAAVTSIDTEMDKLPAALDPVRTVKQNLITALPEPFASNSNASEKAFVLIAWALREANVI